MSKPTNPLDPIKREVEIGFLKATAEAAKAREDECVAVLTQHGEAVNLAEAFSAINDPQTGDDELDRATVQAQWYAARAEILSEATSYLLLRKATERATRERWARGLDRFYSEPGAKYNLGTIVATEQQMAARPTTLAEQRQRGNR